MSLTGVGFRALPRLLTPFYAHVRSVLGLGSLAPWVTFLTSITQPYVRVSRAYDYESIHAQTITTFVFLEQTVTRASMTQP